MKLISVRYKILFGIVIILGGCSVNQDHVQTNSSSANSVTVEIEKQTEVIVDGIGEVDSTADRISAIQDRLIPIETPETESNYENRYKLDIAPFDHFLNQKGYLDLQGQTLNKIDEILGQSPILVRQSVRNAPVRKEIRVYFPYEYDSTGLYIFFLNETVVEFKMDEFNGITQSGLLEFLQ